MQATEKTIFLSPVECMSRELNWKDISRESSIMDSACTSDPMLQIFSDEP